MVYAMDVYGKLAYGPPSCGKPNFMLPCCCPLQYLGDFNPAVDEWPLQEFFGTSSQQPAPHKRMPPAAALEHIGKTYG